jgi:single-strand DNA-binding protein
MSHIFVEGNIGTEPELKYTAGGKAMLKFSIYESRKKGEERVSTWYNVVVWDQMAENAASSVTKGTRVMVQGRLESDDYTNKEGQKVSRTQLTADSVGVSLRWDPIGGATVQAYQEEEEAF